MKKLLFSIFALILPLAIFAEGWDDALYKQIEQNIKAPTFNEKIYKPAIKTTYSAAKNQKAINKAIEKASKNGGGKVVIPAGTYMTGAITLLSDVNLVIEKDAVLKFAFEPELYPLVYTRYEGLDVYNYSPCIYSNGAKNIGITGEGIIDGNGSNETFWQWTGVEFFGYKKGVTKESSKFPREGETMGARAQLQQMCEDNVPIKDRIFGMGRGLRMQLVNRVNSENIIIEGVTMLNSPFWVMHPMFSKNITVRGVKVYNEGPNGDGCDPESCENVLIENCVFDTGDDCIAIKSGRNGDGRRDGRPSKNIIIRNCKMADGHGGVVLGSEISGGVENVFAENCEMDSPNLDRVLRIKTNTCRGGETKNVFMRNVKVGECKEAVLRININYQPREAAERGHIPYVHNVWMENVTCQKSRHGVIINGIQEAEAVYDIHVNNCTFNGVEAEPFVKENRMRDVHFNNLTINGKPASEFTINAYMAAYLGLPIVFLSGDEAMCEAARELVPGITTVASKTGMGSAVISRHPQVVCEEIRAAMEQALSCDVEKRSDCYLTLPESFTVEVEYTDWNRAHRNSFYPGAVSIDPKTISFTATDYFEVMRFMQFCL